MSGISPVMLPIPGTSSLAHLEENLQAARLADRRRSLGARLKQQVELCSGLLEEKGHNDPMFSRKARQAWRPSDRDGTADRLSCSLISQRLDTSERPTPWLAIALSIANLPSVETARLPETYKAAKAALAVCARIDECKDWADKAEAMASYARQSGDIELRKMADRIQRRAIDRVGELIRQIPPAPGQRNDIEPKGAASLRLSPRQQATSAAGLSKFPRKS